MLLHSKFKVPRRPLCRCLSLLIGAFAFTAVSSPRQVSGQQYQPPITNVYRNPTNQFQSPIIQSPIIQSPTIQSPIIQSPADQGQIYRGPTYQGRVYQGPGYYPDLGRIIQQPPASNPTQAPGGFQAVPPVAQRIPQANQPTQPTPQQTLDAEQAAYNAEKLALVEKLLEKYKASAAENQAALKQLQSLKQENSQLVTRMGQLNQTSKSYQTQVLALEEKLSALKQPDPATSQETQQLKANFQKAVTQVNELESTIQKLSGENENYLSQIASLKVAQERATNSMPVESNQTELALKNQQLERLELKFRENLVEYTTIQKQKPRLKPTETTLGRR